jgi:uncharacterized hydrophobic protein (TIGR00271 family)
VIHLRLVVPPTLTPEVIGYLRGRPTVETLVVLPGAGRVPEGDAILCDVAREAASELLDGLRALGVDGTRDDTSIALEEVQAAPSARAEKAERAAPGAPDDAIVWPLVESRAADDAQGSWSFHAFLGLATVIAAIAVVTDSAILVVGAMVVGPEFGPISAMAVGIALRRRRLLVDSLRLLAVGFAAAILATAVLALVARAAGWVDPGDLLRPRPMTNYIWRPDRWSFLVALLAGTAGVLSLTAGRSNALVGVFISVTTVPAAGNLALALALWVPGEMAGSLLQLAVNLVGMVTAGTVLLTLQRVVTARRRRRSGAGPAQDLEQVADGVPPRPTRART